MDGKEEALVRVVEFAVRELRKEGCGRESLKRMVDRICSQLPPNKLGGL